MDPEFEPARRLYSGPAASSSSARSVEPARVPEGALTLAEILPGVRPRTRQRFASTLKLTGLIRPIEGTGHAYAPDAAARLREFADLVRKGGLPIHDALVIVRGNAAPVASSAPVATAATAVDSAPSLIAAPAAVEPVAAPVLVTEEPAKSDALVQEQARPELDQLRRIKDEADRREAAFIAEMSRLKGAIEKFRNETASLRQESAEIIRDLDEERKNARARIARLEALTRTKPAGFWGRIRAAFGVLFGHTAAIPALPAPRSLAIAASEPDEGLRRAA